MRPDQVVTNTNIRKGTVTHSKTSKISQLSHQKKCDLVRENVAKILANNQRLLNQVGGRTIAFHCDSRFLKQQRYKDAKFAKNRLPCSVPTFERQIAKVVPAPRLVCVEVNPGPPKQNRAKKAGNRKAKALLKNLSKKIVQQPKRKKSRVRNSRLSKAGNGISMVSDGVNVGSVWKNTTAERVTFPLAREKFADLTSSGTTFQTLVQQVINPGNSQLFPIFSKIAQNYEQFECNSLKVMFRTEEYMASGSVVSAGLGCLATNFDPDAPNFASFTQAENYEHSNSGAPFSGLIVHDILDEHRKRFGSRSKRGNDLSLNNYYVNYSQNQLAPGSTPAKFYDMGNFQFLVNGTQQGLIGELWIEYSFTLIRRLQVAGAPQGGVCHFSTLTPTSANNFNTMALQAGNTLGGITVTGNTITFLSNQPGNYKVDFTGTAATSWAAVAYASATSGVSLLALTCSSTARDALSTPNSLASTAGAWTMLSMTVTVTAAGGTLVVTPGTIVGANAAADLWFTALPPTVLSVDEREQLEIDELHDEVAELRMIVNKLSCATRSSNEPDSDFDEEKMSIPSSINLATSALPVPLTQSMLSLVNDYVAKKSIK